MKFSFKIRGNLYNAVDVIVETKFLFVFIDERNWNVIFNFRFIFFSF